MSEFKFTPLLIPPGNNTGKQAVGVSVKVVRNVVEFHLGRDILAGTGFNENTTVQLAWDKASRALLLVESSVASTYPRSLKKANKTSRVLVSRWPKDSLPFIKDEWTRKKQLTVAQTTHGRVVVLIPES